MSKTLVIYHSKTGFTKKYAEWISEELNCEMLEIKEAAPEKIADCDTIIFGGGLYAGGITYGDKIKANFDALKDKHLALFTCGIADPADTEFNSEIYDTMVSLVGEEVMGAFKLFRVRGGIDYSKLGFVYKHMLNFMCKSLKKHNRSELNDMEKCLLDCYKKNVDFTDRAYIEDIVAWAKGFEQKDA